ncbi:TRAP transporter small permease subunit [Chloroflexota bacterium]
MPLDDVFMSVMGKVLYAIGRKATAVLPVLSLIIAGVGICLMTALVLSEIIGRNMFGIGVPYAVEFSTYLVVVVGAGGAAYTLRQGRHVRADIVLRRLPNKLRQWLTLIGFILGLGFLIIVATEAFNMALLAIKTKAISMYPTETPVGYFQLILGIGLSLFALQLVIEIIRKAKLLFS